MIFQFDSEDSLARILTAQIALCLFFEIIFVFNFNVSFPFDSDDSLHLFHGLVKHLKKFIQIKQLANLPYIHDAIDRYTKLFTAQYDLDINLEQWLERFKGEVLHLIVDEETKHMVREPTKDEHMPGESYEILEDFAEYARKRLTTKYENASFYDFHQICKDINKCGEAFRVRKNLDMMPPEVLQHFKYMILEELTPSEHRTKDEYDNSTVEIEPEIDEEIGACVLWIGSCSRMAKQTKIAKLISTDSDLSVFSIRKRKREASDDDSSRKRRKLCNKNLTTLALSRRPLAGSLVSYYIQGDLGCFADSKGKILHLNANGKAKYWGIERGWRIVSIDGSAFEQDLLQKWDVSTYHMITFKVIYAKKKSKQWRRMLRVPAKRPWRYFNGSRKFFPDVNSSRISKYMRKVNDASQKAIIGFKQLRDSPAKQSRDLAAVRQNNRMQKARKVVARISLQLEKDKKRLEQLPQLEPIRIENRVNNHGNMAFSGLANRANMFKARFDARIEREKIASVGRRQKVKASFSIIPNQRPRKLGLTKQSKRNVNQGIIAVSSSFGKPSPGTTSIGKGAETADPWVETITIVKNSKTTIKGASSTIKASRREKLLDSKDAKRPCSKESSLSALLSNKRNSSTKAMKIVPEDQTLDCGHKLVDENVYNHEQIEQWSELFWDFHAFLDTEMKKLHAMPSHYFTRDICSSMESLMRMWVRQDLPKRSRFTNEVGLQDYVRNYQHSFIDIVSDCLQRNALRDRAIRFERKRLDMNDVIWKQSRKVRLAVQDSDEESVQSEEILEEIKQLDTQNPAKGELQQIFHPWCNQRWEELNPKLKAVLKNNPHTSHDLGPEVSDVFSVVKDVVVGISPTHACVSQKALKKSAPITESSDHDKTNDAVVAGKGMTDEEINSALGMTSFMRKLLVGGKRKRKFTSKMKRAAKRRKLNPTDVNSSYQSDQKGGEGSDFAEIYKSTELTLKRKRIEIRRTVKKRRRDHANKFLHSKQLPVWVKHACKIFKRAYQTLPSSKGKDRDAMKYILETIIALEKAWIPWNLAKRICKIMKKYLMENRAWKFYAREMDLNKINDVIHFVNWELKNHFLLQIPIGESEKRLVWYRVHQDMLLLLDTWIYAMVTDLSDVLHSTDWMHAIGKENTEAAKLFARPKRFHGRGGECCFKGYLSDHVQEKAGLKDNLSQYTLDCPLYDVRDVMANFLDWLKKTLPSQERMFLARSVQPDFNIYQAVVNLELHKSPDVPHYRIWFHYAYMGELNLNPYCGKHYNIICPAFKDAYLALSFMHKALRIFNLQPYEALSNNVGSRMMRKALWTQMPSFELKKYEAPHVGNCFGMASSGIELIRQSITELYEEMKPLHLGMKGISLGFKVLTASEIREAICVAERIFLLMKIGSAKSQEEIVMLQARLAMLLPFDMMFTIEKFLYVFRTAEELHRRFHNQYFRLFTIRGADWRHYLKFVPTKLTSPSEFAVYSLHKDAPRFTLVNEFGFLPLQPSDVFRVLLGTFKMPIIDLKSYGKQSYFYTFDQARKERSGGLFGCKFLVFVAFCVPAKSQLIPGCGMYISEASGSDFVLNHLLLLPFEDESFESSTQKLESRWKVLAPHVEAQTKTYNENFMHANELWNPTQHA